MFRYFLLGILTVYIALPIIDSVLAVILTLLEYIKSYLTLQISTINIKIKDIENTSKKLNKIGFIQEVEQEVEDSGSEASVL